MRVAPGFFHNAQELDPEYAHIAQQELNQRKHDESSSAAFINVAAGWIHGSFGRSTQYDVPVSELVRPRITVTAHLLFVGVSCGWLCALCLALPLGLRTANRGETIIRAINIVLLAFPVGALCTLLLLTDFGGPTVAISIVVAGRDFKLIYKLLRRSSRSACLTYARAQGLSRLRMVCFHLLPSISEDVLAIGAVSVILALSSIVPIEVLFDIPGLGQLAWSAAMNRDLPVLTMVTFVMAACVGLLAVVTNSYSAQEAR